VVAVAGRDTRVTTRNDTILHDGKRVLLLAPVGPRTLPQDQISGGVRRGALKTRRVPRGPL